MFDVDGWACPECNKPMKLRTVIIRPPVTDTVILGLRGSAGVGLAQKRLEVGRMFLYYRGVKNCSKISGIGQISFTR